MTQSVTQRENLTLLDLTGVPASTGMQRIIEQAIRLGASDLFLVTNEQHVAVMVRCLGLVELLAILDSTQGLHYISHVRAEAGLDMLDYRRPQDGRWIYKVEDQEPVDLRISVVPTLHGQDMSIRLLVRAVGLRSLDDLGMTADQVGTYRSMLDQPGGLTLVTGPTGSGKTVCLYASLGHLKDGHRKIHTIEDPIEYAVDGLRQSQVNSAMELEPAELLRGVLRQSADVIMIGEIRDARTAEAAIWAANSGVRVLTTVHAPSAAGAIQSLRGFGVSSIFLANSLRCIINTRLLRTLCPDCRQTIADAEDARAAYTDIASYLPEGLSGTHYTSTGCAKCNETGFNGRTGVFEIMPISDTMRSMIIKGKSTRQIRARASEEGALPLRHAALLKSAQGISSLAEIRRLIPNAVPILQMQTRISGMSMSKAAAAPSASTEPAPAGV